MPAGDLLWPLFCSSERIPYQAGRVPMANKRGVPKANILKRIVARTVDCLIAWVLALFLPPIGVILGLVYLAVADGLQKGQSLGKMVFGLDVVKQDGSPCDLRSSMLRNIPFVLVYLFYALGFFGWILLVIVGLPLLLIELWLVYVDDQGERMGDRIADTHVIEGPH
ncbi:RDD family protein [bacterium]|nr:MAG: RDD family protein [bacterium]